MLYKGLIFRRFLKRKIIKKIKLLIFDFDGVLTNNKVIVNEEGLESVVCDRADGLAFDSIKLNHLNCLILSTETNKVVKVRAEKIGIKVINGVSDKLNEVRNLADSYNIDLDNIMFIGNDLNDLSVVKAVGISACPADSHPLIKKYSTFILRNNGGNSVVREIVERILYIDIVDH